ncbi:hypothetical protein J2T12_003877 [Paenibacillus anaericanus]|uniref:hypothetical protein n=1 Tax=Paenibacillus anaericanus TaxID=170367 RepID=UPI00278B1287|nr:hypothetical protein [Paenibacillus anaericanus]MDQ0090454.1 hypothetical protein [Paenibacillus anaericanus]
MSKKIITLSLIILLIAGLAFNYLSPYSEKLMKSTNLSNESIGGVKIHESINESSFIAQYGNPLSKQDNDLYDYYYWKGGLETASIHSGKDKDSIMRLIITITDKKTLDKPLHTAKGIELGDAKEKVISLYGNNYYKSNEQGVDIIGYIDHEQDITLEFWCTNVGEVAEIRLDDSSVK